MLLPERIANLPVVQQIDTEALIGVVFTQSPSRSYSEAIAFAKKARVYGEIRFEKKLIHYAVFGRDKTQASLAIAVTNAVKAWKDTKFFAHSRLLSQNQRVEEVLRCYLDSLEVADPKSYCHGVFRHLSEKYMNGVMSNAVDKIRRSILVSRVPILAKFGFVSRKTSIQPDRYLIPCRMLHGFVEYALFRDALKSPTENDLKSLAVKRGSYWCPHFRASNFRKLADTNLNESDEHHTLEQS
jgi:hypothetical protein